MTGTCYQGKFPWLRFLSSSVADPGFRRGQGGDAKKLLFGKIFAENYLDMEEM